MEELVKAGIVSSENYKKAKMIQAKKGGAIGEILVDIDAVDVNRFIHFIQGLTE